MKPLGTTNGAAVLEMQGTATGAAVLEMQGTATGRGGGDEGSCDGRGGAVEMKPRGTAMGAAEELPWTSGPRGGFTKIHESIH